MKIKGILAIVLIMLLCSGCGAIRNWFKHTKSYMIGLDRKVTLYSTDGKIIRTWDTRAQIEDNGGTVYFIATGHAYTVSGTFVVVCLALL